MATPKKFISVSVVLCLALFLIATPECFAGKGGSKGKATKYLESRSKHYETEAVTGTVLEVLRQSDRLYLKIDTGKKKQWTAIPIPAQNIAVGDTVALQPGIVMKDMHVRSLNQNINRIIFSEGLQ